jgi:hypothetical protein
VKVESAGRLGPALSPSDGRGMLKVLGAMAMLAVLAAGCGSGDAEPSAATRPTATPTPAATPEPEAGHDFEKGHSRAVRKFYGDVHGPEAGVEAEYHQPPRPPAGGIGDTITLTGSNIGVRFDVTVTGLIDPAATARRPRPGMRYVGVGVELVSTGITVHEDEIDGLLRYGARGRVRAMTGVKAGCSNGFQRVLRIDVGLSARGCLLFQVPASARPRQFLLALEQVPPEAGGRWRLR